MEIPERYTWEAEKTDGTVITSGGDLAGCVRFSLIPRKPGLPRHDIVGAPMVRRFCRGFIKTHLNRRQELPGKVFWKHGAREIKTDTDLSGHLKPGDLIGKGVDGEKWYPVLSVKPDRVILLKPFEGTSKPRGMFARKINANNRQGHTRKYLHCVVCRDCRIWFDYLSGAVLVTEQDVEIYI